MSVFWPRIYDERSARGAARLQAGLILFLALVPVTQIEMMALQAGGAQNYYDTAALAAVAVGVWLMSKSAALFGLLMYTAIHVWNIFLGRATLIIGIFLVPAFFHALRATSFYERLKKTGAASQPNPQKRLQTAGLWGLGAALFLLPRVFMPGSGLPQYMKPSPEITQTEEGIEFQTPGAPFTVRLPFEPVPVEQVIESSRFGTVIDKIYVARYPDGLKAYTVSHGRIPQAIASAEVEQALKKLNEETALQMNARLLRSEAITFQGEPGVEYEMEIPFSGGRVMKAIGRTLLIGRDICQLAVQTMIDHPPASEEVETYFHSFKILGRREPS